MPVSTINKTLEDLRSSLGALPFELVGPYQSYFGNDDDDALVRELRAKVEEVRGGVKMAEALLELDYLPAAQRVAYAARLHIDRIAEQYNAGIVLPVADLGA